MSNSASIEGVNELLNTIDPVHAASSVLATMDSILTRLDRALKQSVSSKFTARNSLNLLAQSVHVEGNSIVGTLNYEHQYSDLSKFPTTWVMGNINSGARRQGRVHTTTVVRGKPHTIVGRSHHGGFLLLDKGGRPKKYGRHGTQMVERIGSKKLPLRLLLGPSTFTMINWSFRKDPKIAAAITNFQYSVMESYL